MKEPVEGSFPPPIKIGNPPVLKSANLLKQPSQGITGEKTVELTAVPSRNQVNVSPSREIAM